ncbi:MAG TPA: NYN domain-containing protein [Pirellulales bacterium]|nr:NYN domain-containing protein [Pirellulales bacterium]
MVLIIDGYNLMHASGIFGRGRGPGGFERSRLALLNFVAESVAPTDLSTTTVVFDARQAPPGLPRRLVHREITVLFAAGYESADELIEELIRATSAPRRLLVVSSDHRVQRAARRRRARSVDSDQWYAEMVRKRGAKEAPAPSAFTKPVTPASGEVEFWLAQFDDEQGDGDEEVDGGEIFPAGYGEDVEE